MIGTDLWGGDRGRRRRGLGGFPAPMGTGRRLASSGRIRRGRPRRSSGGAPPLLASSD